jgi:dihydroneopterin aldolase
MNRPLSATFAALPRDAQGRPLDVIELNRLSVQCIVGVYPAERGTPQPLDLDVALYLDTRRAATAGSLRDTVDYARLAGELRFLLETSSFRMLETAAEALCRYILAPPTEDQSRAQVRAVALRLAKPGALGQAALASLQVHRSVDEYELETRKLPSGQVDTVFQDEHVGIYRLRIAPGGTITPEHRVMSEAALVLGHGLLLQGRPVLAGTGFRWPRRGVHRYENPRALEQTVLYVDRPATSPGDEEELPRVEGRAYYPEAATTPEAEGW